LCSTGLFHPASTSRLRPSGSSPRQEPLRLVAAALPSCGYRAAASSFEATSTKPHFRAFFSWRVRCHRSTVKRTDARSPPGLLPLQGLPHLGVGTCFHAPPLTSFPAPSYETPRTAPQGLASPKDGLVSRETACPLEVPWPFRSLERVVTPQTGLIVSPRSRSRVTATPALLFGLSSLPAGAARLCRVRPTLF